MWLAVTARKRAEFITGEAARDRDEDIYMRMEELCLVTTADVVGLGSAMTDGENPRYYGYHQVSRVFAASQNHSRALVTSSSYPPHELPKNLKEKHEKKN